MKMQKKQVPAGAKKPAGLRGQSVMPSQKFRLEKRK